MDDDAETGSGSVGATPAPVLETEGEEEEDEEPDLDDSNLRDQLDEVERREAEGRARVESLAGGEPDGGNPIEVEERYERGQMGVDFYLEMLDRPEEAEEEEEEETPEPIDLEAVQHVLIAAAAAATLPRVEESHFESERTRFAEAKSTFEVEKNSILASLKEMENAIKSRAEESFKLLDEQRRLLALETEKIAVERAQVSEERQFRFKLLEEQAKARDMEETAWNTLWQERKQYEAEVTALRAERDKTRKEVEILERETVDSRRGLLYREQEIRRTIIDGEVARLEAQIRNMKNANYERSLGMGLDLHSAPPQPPSEAKKRSPPATPEKVHSMAAHLVDIEAHSLDLAIQYEQQVQRNEARSAYGYPSWILHPAIVKPASPKIRRATQRYNRDLYQEVAELKAEVRRLSSKSPPPRTPSTPRATPRRAYHRY